MEQDQTQEKDQVLIARDNESGKIGAVTGMNDDGTPKMSDVKSAKLSDLVKFNIRQNPLEAFMSNFLRQCKNPSMFSFFKVDADNYEKEAPVMGEMLKDPETHKSMLEDREVKPSDEIRETQKNKPVDESKIDWAELKERWGVDKEQLEKSGDLREMLFNRKSALVTITTDVGGKVQQVDARLSFQTDEQGKVNNEFSYHGELLSCKAECFLGDFVAYALYLDNHAAGSNGSHESFGRTFTFTHSDFGRLLGDGLVGEDTDPDLTLTLHIAGNRDTGSFDLTSGDPLGFEGLDTEGAEGQGIATLGISLHAAFLHAAEFGFLRL